MLVWMSQVCLATTGTWPDEPCEARLHLKQEHTTRKAVVPAAATDHVFSLVVDTSTIQYIDSVTARVLREVKTFSCLPKIALFGIINHGIDNNDLNDNNNDGETMIVIILL